MSILSIEPPKVGRPKQEPTVQRRIPTSLVKQVEAFIEVYKGKLPGNAQVFENRTQLKIPLASEAVRAGFPSPAEPYITDYIDFNEYLIQNPESTICVRSGGWSMINAGIWPDDLLLIDRAITPQNRHIVLAELDGEFTIKRLIRTATGIELHPENEEFEIIKIGTGVVLTIVGVVKWIIKAAK